MSEAVNEPGTDSASGGAPVRRPPMHRLPAAAVFAVTLGVLLVAASLEPAAAGYGTHEDLGLPACGFKSLTSLPCVTCGMTTAFSHAANGDLIAAFGVQPTGTLLALATAMGAVVSGSALVFGFSLAPLGRMLMGSRVLLALGVLLLVGWGYTSLVAVGW